MSDVTLRPAQPGEVEKFLDGETPNERLEWHPVGLTYTEWTKKVDGYPMEQGTLYRTEKGVYCAGMCGAFFLGQKREDGSVEKAIDFTDNSPNDGDFFVIEYADPPNCGYRRNELGAVVNPGTGEAEEKILIECERELEAKEALYEIMSAVYGLQRCGAKTESVIEYVKLLLEEEGD